VFVVVAPPGVAELEALLVASSASEVEDLVGPISASTSRA
jgi:hypothetical protein